MAVPQDRQGVAEALAGALVLADLSDPKLAAGFSIEVGRVMDWATQAGDEVVEALASEIQHILGKVAAGDQPALEAAALIGDMIAVMMEAGPTGHPGGNEPLVMPQEDNPYARDEGVLADFAAGAREQLDEAEAMLSACAVGGEADVDALFRCFHTLKGIAGFLSLSDMATVAHDVESSLESARSSGADLDEPTVAGALSAVDAIRAMVAEVDARRAKPARAAKAAASAQAASRAQETVRVDASRLEGLLDAIGELVVAESELAAAIARLGDDAAERSLERLTRIARDMQGTATSLRMVGLAPTFRKMTRVVRDMIAASGKKVELKVSGGETELDRTIVEGISDPLVHLLRNAIDHGIEPPAERAAAGKSEVGVVELRAFHRSGSVHIEIADDGRGIDPERVLAKAAALGIEADRDRALDLIFRPGFSTADQVTEISGRGVGMDAVATAVSGLRGQLDVQSVPGEGTVFTIRLPLTLAVIDGIVMRAGEERYIVPTEFVERTVSTSEGEIVSAAGRGQTLVLPDGPVAVRPITASMGGELETGCAAVILDDGDNRFALLVDEVVGQQSLVIKALSGPAARATGVAGAALMGDGRAALVIDPFGIAKAMRGGR